MEIIKNVNFTMKDIINAQNSTQVLKNHDNEQVKVTGLLVAEKESIDSETGEIEKTKIGVLKVDGALISSISATVINSILSIIGVYEEHKMVDEISKGLDIIIKSDKSSKGRDFFFLELA